MEEVIDVGMTDKQFKAYIRALLRDYKDVEQAIKEKNLPKSEELVKKLIEDAQKNIED